MSRIRKYWVVGGTSGIGLATADWLARYGQAAFISGREVSVDDTGQLRVFAEKWGPFDGLVYSAGVHNLQWAEATQPHTMMALYDVNVVGLLRVLQALDFKVERTVVVGSDAGWRPMRTSLAYCCSKAALEMAVQVIARERASDQFAINLVAPGMTQPTDMQEYVDAAVPTLRGWTEAQAAEYEMSMTPLKRRAHVSEVAEVVGKTLMMETPYLNGATIAVNGAR